MKSRFPSSALGRLALLSLFATAPRVAYAVEVSGLEHAARVPRTYIAIQHKRDFDPVAPLPAVLRRWGWRGMAGEVHFAMRSDAFEAGFLSRIVLRPRWFSLALRPLSVGPLLRGLGVHPLADLHQRPAETWLRDAQRVEGDVPAGDILTSAFLADLASASQTAPDQLAALPLSRLLTRRYHLALQRFTSADIFAGEAHRRAVRRSVGEAKRLLEDLSVWLWAGGSLFSAPEGQLSPTGTLSPINNALHRILRTAPPETRILPIALVYDFMTTRRPRIFVDLAPAIERSPALSHHDLDAHIYRAWRCAAHFTCTQIASGFIIEVAQTRQPATFTTGELAVATFTHARQLAAAGRHVDPRLLDTASVRQRVSAYLTYARRHHLVRRLKRGIWQITGATIMPPVPPGEVGYRFAPLAYAYNELRDLLDV